MLERKSHSDASKTTLSYYKILEIEKRKNSVGICAWKSVVTLKVGLLNHSNFELFCKSSEYEGLQNNLRISDNLNSIIKLSPNDAKELMINIELDLPEAIALNKNVSEKYIENELRLFKIILKCEDEKGAKSTFYFYWIDGRNKNSGRFLHRTTNFVLGFVYLLFALRLIYAYIDQCHADRNKKMLINSLPKIDVVLSLNQVRDSSFDLSFNIINSGATDAKNVTKEILVNEVLYFYTYFKQPTPFLHLPANKTVSVRTIRFPFGKRGATTIDITIGYLDSLSNPHSCLFHFVLPNSSIEDKQFYPDGVSCSENHVDTTMINKMNVMSTWIGVEYYPNSRLRVVPQYCVSSQFSADSRGELNFRFRNTGQIPVLAIGSHCGFHADSMHLDSITSLAIRKWNGDNGVILDSSICALGITQIPDYILEKAENGKVYFSGYLVYRVPPFGLPRRYTYQGFFDKQNRVKYVFEFDDYIRLKY